MPFLPYAIGGFMLLPFVLWAGLFMLFPGPKPGITDAPLTAALVAVSAPMVLFHYIAALAYVANSMAGKAGQDIPLWAPARWAQRAMAPLGVIVSVAAFVWLQAQGETLALSSLIAGAGLFMSAVMAVARRPRRSAVLMAAPGRVMRRTAGLIVRVAMALPIIGHVLREAARDPHRAAPFILVNSLLAIGALVAVFGVAGLVIPAMLAVPVIFYLLLSLGDA